MSTAFDSDSPRQTLARIIDTAQPKTLLSCGALADEVASRGEETLSRQASDALYHVTTAALLAGEGARLGAAGGDAGRLLLARMVLDHRLRPQDPLAAEDGDGAMIDALLSPEPVSLDQAQALVSH